ncbi:MAG: pyridoxal phosphate-dependent aminotransferase [Deltaproteobacteria bacterium]|nr:pyridoxal phosphate-dependent aminotransferase [Deltaproteobacteria bacterium]
MPIARKISDFMERSSWIRRMFEEGRHLKAEYGDENVFDFSLGNPSAEPPPEFTEALIEVAHDTSPCRHVYMPNPGFPETRHAIADYVSREQGVTLSGDNVMMTCGAAGALNIIFKTLLNPGEEVILLTPYFAEYYFYVDNSGGVPVLVPTAEDFSLDVAAIEEALNQKTRAILVNSPNNPSGRVYSESNLKELVMLLDRKSREYGRPIYLIADEPYRKIVYDDVSVPAIFPLYQNSLIATSFSKSLSLAGERIGYIAAHPGLEGMNCIMDGFILCIRILGFVNAPAIMQRVIARVTDAVSNVEEYKRKRDLLCDGLGARGYQFHKPEGAFYLFPRTFIDDDIAFVRELQGQNILTVPGSGFGTPGYFRISYCVADETITRAMEGFGRVAEKYL